MGNPYETLGIKEGASEQEIRIAYKELAKKYHPDRYQANPLAGLAEDKMREINEAYDYLMKNKGNAGVYSGSYGGSGNAGTTAEFKKIRRDLDAGRLQEAEDDLNRIGVKNTEWVYLQGILYYKRGWYDEAYSNIQKACDMEPNNFEYRRALNTIESQGVGYRRGAAGRGYQQNPNDCMCQACQLYICADCCCDCI